MINRQNNSIQELLARGGLGRHETFTPRYGWLKKGYDAVIRDSGIFKKDYAIVELGVGKNMVRSIRSWCLAFNIMSPNGAKMICPSEFGKRLLDTERGWDPFLEDDASLWLLHWQLFVPPFEAISWPLAFNYCNLSDFGIEELSRIIYNAGQAYPSLARISPKTYRRDASCLLRMYTDPEKKNSDIDCPFSQLGLMYLTGEGNRVSFNTATKPTLPALIVAAACFSYAVFHLPLGQKVASLQQFVFGLNSPGVAFKLPETVIGQYLSDASKEVEGFRLVDVLGHVQLHFDQSPEELYFAALDKFYSER